VSFIPADFTQGSQPPNIKWRHNDSKSKAHATYKTLTLKEGCEVGSTNRGDYDEYQIPGDEVAYIAHGQGIELGLQAWFV
jgi:hypothetical protein